jgi:4-carboxymuconolactone decarboxylase
MTDDERYEAGMQVRRAVLGDAHVDRSLANRTALTEEFQGFITRYACDAAKNNGVTRDEIKEVLLQTAIYCGVPAANSAFHLADRIFREEDAQP